MPEWPCTYSNLAVGAACAIGASVAPAMRSTYLGVAAGRLLGEGLGRHPNEHLRTAGQVIELGASIAGAAIFYDRSGTELAMRVAYPVVWWSSMGGLLKLMAQPVFDYAIARVSLELYTHYAELRAQGVNIVEILTMVSDRDTQGLLALLDPGELEARNERRVRQLDAIAPPTAVGDVAVDDCAICQCGYDDVDTLIRTLPCGHAFHAGCLEEWMFRQSTCPMCRAEHDLSAPPQGQAP